MTRHDAPDHRDKIVKGPEQTEGDSAVLKLLQEANVGGVRVDAVAAPFLKEMRKDPDVATRNTQRVVADAAQLTDDIRKGQPVDLVRAAEVSQTIKERTLAVAASVKSIQDRLERTQAQI